MTHAFRAVEDGAGHYSKLIATDPTLSEYEVVHYGVTYDYEDQLLAIEAARGTDVTTILHAQNAGVSKTRIADLDQDKDASEKDWVYSGHWVYRIGATAKETIPAASSGDSTTIPLSSVKTSDGSTLYRVGDDVLITYWDAANKTRFWENFEEVRVTAVDTTNVTITVSRGQDYGKNNPTTAAEWAPGTYEVLLTPHAIFSEENQWFLNVSLVSPEDPSTGLNGWEFFADDFYQNYWRTNGTDEKDVTDSDESDVTVRVDGVVFDGGRWVLEDGTKWANDVDNDNVADYGFVGGVNVLGLGTLKYLAALREKLSDRILLIDASTVDVGFRAWGSAVNGMEDENFWADGQEFSEAFINFQQWVGNVAGRESFSYVFTKEDTKLYACDAGRKEPVASNARFRVGFSTSLMVGMAHPYGAETESTYSSVDDDGDGTADPQRCFDAYPWDEEFGGDLNDGDWLGAAKSEAAQDTGALGEDDLLAGATWDCAFVDETSGNLTCGTASAGYQAASVETTESDGTVSRQLNVSTVPTATFSKGDAYYPSPLGAFLRAVVASANQSVTSDEFTVTFYAKAENTYDTDYSWASGQAPRVLGVRLTDTSSSGQAYYQRVLVPSTETLYRLSFKMDSATGVKKVTFFSGEEPGSVTVRDAHLLTGSANRWLRYFEGGAAVINATASDWTVTLDPTLAFDSPDADTTFAGYASRGFKRLKGDLDPDVNDGSEGSGDGKNVFTVPAGDALLVAVTPVPDSDADGIDDDADNCKFVSNPNQEDLDGDGAGDVCDLDRDGDGIESASDNCEAISNADQKDTDGDKSGDACDSDIDGDGMPNEHDLCPTVAASGAHEDADADGTGDECDDDRDGDGFANSSDTCPDLKTASAVPDADADGKGDDCDDDRDGDGVTNANDNCASVANADQKNTDGDAQGDLCDADIDGDGSKNTSDCAPADASISPLAKEVCNGTDDDCDGAVDDGLAVYAYYRDADSDKYGAKTSSLFGVKKTCQSAAPTGYVKTNTDCNDFNAKIYPGAVETVGNGKDDNCDGVVK